MTIWSCTIFQINQKCQPFIENILTSTNSEYVYDIWKKSDDDEEELKLYIDFINNRSSGTTIDIQMDRPSSAYYVRGEDPHKFRVTVRLGAHIFKKTGWPLVIGVFGQRDNAERLRIALKKIYLNETGLEDTPVYAVGFRLRDRDENLLQAFPNMKKMKVSGIQGSQVRTAVLTGNMLEESPEYQKWVKDEDYSGRVNYFGVTIGDEMVVLSTIGNMYSRQGKNPRPVGLVEQVLQNFLDCHALVYTPTLDLF